MILTCQEQHANFLRQATKDGPADSLRRTEFAATKQADASTVPDLMAHIEEAEVRARIQRARKEAGLSQPQLAELLEVITRTVQNYEATDGKNGTVPWEKLNQIAEITGKSVGWLLHGDDDEIAMLTTRLEEFEHQQAAISEKLARLLPDDDAPLTPESAAAMFRMMEQAQAQLTRQFEEWARQMGEHGIGKRELDRLRRRAARATDHPEQPTKASRG